MPATTPAATREQHGTQEGTEMTGVSGSAGGSGQSPLAGRLGGQGRSWVLAGLALLAVAALSARAHFLVLLPSTDIAGEGSAKVALHVLFTHPMAQGPAMELARPTALGVLVGGERTDLLGTLQAAPVQGKSAWRLDYTCKVPGDHVFFCEPAPYWEPAEGKLIVHYTKVVVCAFDAMEGWDAMVGFPVEIEPLTRPYGLWTGNLFRGVVRRDGKPVPFAEIEVEHWNEGGKVQAPGEAFVTQVLKADANGTFAYGLPRAGWWGFAALVEGEQRPDPEGKPVPVELGALLWVRAVDMGAAAGR